MCFKPPPILQAIKRYWIGEGSFHLSSPEGEILLKTVNAPQIDPTTKHTHTHQTRGIKRYSRHLPAHADPANKCILKRGRVEDESPAEINDAH